ncbi:MAG: limonene-1,2-epoxide hydrolase [bacterium]|nr:limonene-1,2-epoxide hydrolase [Deltaproteobacteria bacterium]MCP4906323.1 limonene-1,2-epoxide hydrolase [bacterium]
MDAEAVVRDLCEAFSRMNVDELLGFFTPDAVYEKMPVGRFAGEAEIRGTLDEFFGPEVRVQFKIANLVSAGNTVCVERVIEFKTVDHEISLPAMAIFEVNDAGKVTAWRDYFDRRQAGLD